MNVEAVKAFVKAFIDDHSSAFADIAQRQSQLLELGGLVAIERHYQSNGYTSVVVGPNGSKTREFVVKTSTSGHPSRYSRLLVHRDSSSAEIHLNVSVAGAHDGGTYCVDVGVVRPGSIPESVSRRAPKWVSIANADLITFGEVKRLVVYPMLLAQFLGIVHEIAPQFFGGSLSADFTEHRHLPPALMALGHFSSNSALIVRRYRDRGIRVCIAEGLDLRMASHQRRQCKSPLYWDDDSPTYDPTPQSGPSADNPRRFLPRRTRLITLGDDDT